MSLAPPSFGLEPSIGWSFVGLFALLVVATAALLLLRRLRPDRDYQDVFQRTMGWWVVVAALLAAFLVGPVGVLLLFGAASVQGFRELVGMAGTPVARPLWWLGLGAIAVQYGLVAAGEVAASMLFIPLVMGLALPAAALFAGVTDGFTRQVATVHMALMLGGFCLSMLPLLMVMPGAGGHGLIAYALILAQLNDVAQYYWGKLAGRTPIVPRISPKKTWGGFLGGVLTMAALGWALAPVFTPLPQSWGLLVGVMVAVAGFLGDLTVSALKREAGVKDAGSLLPGFGGVMDRLDSMVYVAPAFVGVLLWWLR